MRAGAVRLLLSTTLAIATTHQFGQDGEVESVTLRNVSISYLGGGTVDDANRVVAEDVDRCPEQYCFGGLPALGAYVRHARNVQFINVKLTTRAADARQRTYLQDVEGFIDR